MNGGEQEQSRPQIDPTGQSGQDTEKCAEPAQTGPAPEQLLAQLPAIRRGGYAEEHEEYRLGLKSVAAPIYEGDGPCRYAIGVICIAGTPAAEFASMRAAVMETAQNLSALLGHRAPGGI